MTKNVLYLIIVPILEISFADANERSMYLKS